jgi:WD repeat-containing protein 68
MATFMMDRSRVIIIEVRAPSTPVAELTGHSGPVNGVCWAPHTNNFMCSVGDDSAALIWEISGLPKQIDDPILAYTAESEINQLQWSSLHPDWISIGFDKKMQILKV